MMAALQGGLAMEPGSPRATGAPGGDAHVLTALLLGHQFQGEAQGPRHQKHTSSASHGFLPFMFYEPFIKCKVTYEKTHVS